MATAYQGNKPYIFLSYAHKDKELAHSVIKYLQEHNNYVWFDEGIHSGTQWEDVIIGKIKNCWMMVFLVTKNSLASDWCRQELTFAKDIGKKFINVVIGNPAFPDWFNFSYKRYQFLYEKNFTNRDAMMVKLVEELIHHAMNTDKPTDTPKDTTKDTPKETSAVKPLPPEKAPEVAKVPKASVPTQKSSEPSVAPKCPFELGSDDGLEFSIVDGTATVTGYTGTETKVIIPAKITYDGKTYNVTSIGENAFFNCTILTSINIPNSVTSIGKMAFYDCTNLTSITIPESVTSIGNYAFRDCKKLTSITIPDSVTTIGAEAFAWCSSLTSITIPNSVTSIGESAFHGCENLTSITIPNSVTSIGDLAFGRCTSLTSITIPNSVTSIGDGAFACCENLTSIVVDENNRSYKSIDGNLYSRDGSTLIQYAIGKTNTSFTIPNSVTSIGESVFEDCKNLTSITIPDTVTSIGEWAFYCCENLTIYCEAKSKPEGWHTDWNPGNHPVVWEHGSSEQPTAPKGPLKLNAANGLKFTVTVGTATVTGYKGTNTKVIIPAKITYDGNSYKVTSIGKHAFAWCKNLTSISIPNSVTSIGGQAFWMCENLTSVTIPDSVTSIGYQAFYLCTSLTMVTISDSVTSIGYEAFWMCKNLTSITIPDSVTSIGAGAFFGCDNLTSVTIPDSVTSIGDGAFGGCISLTSIVVDKNNTHYKSTYGNLYTKDGSTLIQYAIGKTSTSFTIPNGVTTIGKSAFAGCKNLTSISIPNSVTTIGEDAFRECYNLTIYCEAKSKPKGWDTNWNYNNRPVVWGYVVGE